LSSTESVAVLMVVVSPLIVTFPPTVKSPEILTLFGRPTVTPPVV
jgi:hypothetical protein